jgi:nicotinamide mononucleotide transporter
VIRELSIQLVSAWHDTSWIEFTAAVLAVAYLLLAIRQRLSCWVAAFISSCPFVWVFFTARLYMESLPWRFMASGSGNKARESRRSR